MMPRRPGNEEAQTKTNKKHPYLPEIEINDKTPRGQQRFAEGWNSMRKHLLEVGEMEDK